MIKHVLLIAVLEEMGRLENRLGVLFEKRPEDWQEIYAGTRRQIRLCIDELVGLAQNDLALSEADAQKLVTVFDAFRDRYLKHVERWPIEGIDLADPVCVQSFHALRNASSEFKSVMRGLIERYQVNEDDT